MCSQMNGLLEKVGYLNNHLVLMLICDSKSNSISSLCVKLGVLEFGVYTFRVVMSSWLTISLIIMKCFYLSLLITFSLTSTLSYVKIVTSACFLELFDWKTFVYPFTLSGTCL